MDNATKLPSYLPRNTGELVRRYHPIVVRVSRLAVYGISHRDAQQELWTRLMRARVVERFVANKLSVDPSLPESVFRKYLIKATNNHMKNIFRTLARRANRERAYGDDELLETETAFRRSSRGSERR